MDLYKWLYIFVLFFCFLRGEGAGEGQMVMKGAEALVILKGGWRLTDSLPLI